MTHPRTIAPGETRGCLFRCRIGKACRGLTLVAGCESRAKPGVCSRCEREGYVEELHGESTFRGLLHCCRPLAGVLVALLLAGCGAEPEKLVCVRYDGGDWNGPGECLRIETHIAGLDSRLQHLEELAATDPVYVPPTVYEQAEEVQRLRGQCMVYYGRKQVSEEGGPGLPIWEEYYAMFEEKCNKLHPLPAGFDESGN